MKRGIDIPIPMPDMTPCGTCERVGSKQDFERLRVDRRYTDLSQEKLPKLGGSTGQEETQPSDDSGDEQYFLIQVSMPVPLAPP